MGQAWGKEAGQAEGGARGSLWSALGPRNCSGHRREVSREREAESELVFSASRLVG